METEERTITLPEKDYNKLHSDGFTKFDDRILASTEFTPSEKIWLMFIRSKRSYFEKNRLIEPDGWFYCLQRYISEGTDIPERTQTNIIKNLTAKGILEVSVRFNNSVTVNYYRINNLVYEEFAQKKNTDPQFLRVKQNQQVTEGDNRERSAIFAGRDPQKLRAKEIKENKIKSLLEPFGLVQAATPPGADLINNRGLHPRKKILINRSTPLVIEDDLEPIKPHIVKKRRNIVPKKSDDVLDIIDHWRDKGFSVHREGTNSEIKAIKDINALLDGSLFASFKDRGIIRRYKKEEVKKSIDNFALAAFNQDYQPSNVEFKYRLQHIGLSTFFYDVTKGDDTNKSLFIRYFFNKPKLVSESSFLVRKDTHPHITKTLYKWYHDKFTDRTNGSVQDMNAFVITSNKLEQFLLDNKAKLRLEYFHMMYGCYDNLKCLTIQLTRAMDKELRENDTMWRDFHPGWLTTEKTFADRLPRFLKSEHMMKL